MSHANTNLGNARHKGKFVSMSLYNKLSALKSNPARKASQQPNDVDISLISHVSSLPCDLDHSYTVSLYYSYIVYIYKVSPSTFVQF